MDPKPETNKQTVLDFYEVGLNQKDFADGDLVIAHVHGVRVPGRPGMF